MTSRFHLAIAALVALLLPAASWIDGSGFLAFRMYARGRGYRIHVNAWDAAETLLVIAPTAMASRTAGSVRHFLAGSDRWIDFPRGDFLAEHLPELAKLACATAARATRVEVQIERRTSANGPVDIKTLATPCIPR